MDIHPGSIPGSPILTECRRIGTLLPMTQIGEKYEVSDNAVRKWAKRYEIDIKKVKEFVINYVQ